MLPNTSLPDSIGSAIQCMLYMKVLFSILLALPTTTAIEQSILEPNPAVATINARHSSIYSNKI